jgi:uncharacterized repeat protein (TIGR03847 family)
MSASFDLDEVDSFMCAAIGEPGARVFYLQAATGTVAISLKLEKMQVGLLADYLERLIQTQELPDGPPAVAADLVQPIIPEWIVGSMMVAINEASGRVIVIAQELTEGDEDDDEDEDDLIEDPDMGQMRVALSRNQVIDFIARARDLIAGGRETCRLCGRPMDTTGHACPRWN